MAEAMTTFLTINPLIHEPMAVVAVLLGILAVLFSVAGHEVGKKVFKFVPFLVFAYFVPTLFSNTGIIPIASPGYKFVKEWFLPASLLLLTLSVDIPAILGLGRNAVILFLTATATIVIGGPIAYLILHGFVPEELGEEAWKGLAALSGSWIGGGANMIAIGNSVGVSSTTIGLIVVVDVAVANVWMAVLLWFAGREKEMDEKIGAGRASLDRCREKAESYNAEATRTTSLSDLVCIVALAIVGTAIARYCGDWLDLQCRKHLPMLTDYVSRLTWIVLIVTFFGVACSFTKVRRLEGAGASKVGSLFLYLLVASIGAQAEFYRVKEAPALVAIGALWMLIHAVILLLVRRWLKAPIFFAAVGSKANIGGAASAPIVAAAFHPALAPVGVLLAVGGYVLGTVAGLCCAFLLKMVHNFVG